jgi:hypothetical protein
VRVIVALAVLVVALPAAGATTPPNGLRGIVSVAMPVCADDDACRRPLAGFVLAFRRDGRVVARVTSGEGGRYRVLLRPGIYELAAGAPRTGPRADVLPRTARVRAGIVRRVDVLVDRGLQ